jgi:pimeloyl-ACP methyl ester carboxylesterase
MSACRSVLAIVFVSLSVNSAQAQKFDAKGVKIRYLVKGKGEPVVLIHGLYSNGLINWILPGIFAELAKDHAVIVLDLPGHGRSDRPNNKEAYGVQMVDDIVLLLDHLKVKKAHVVGYSMGGAVAVKFMARHTDRVLSGTVGGMGWFREGSALQKMWEKLPAAGRAPPQAFFDAVGALAVTEKELRSIKAPVKVLVGDRDVVKQLYVEPLQKVRKDWPVVEIQNADHFSCLMQRQFRDEIALWVRKNSK